MIAYYQDFIEINPLQRDIMKFVGQWVHEKKTPVPRKEIIKKLEETGINMPTTRKAIYSLISKGYIREAVMISNTTAYVQLRSL